MKDNFQKKWIKDLSAFLFLGLLVILKFWNFLIPKDKLYWAGDFLEVTPMRDYFYHHLKQGGLILWNSHIAGGMPYLAADYGAFYPIDLLMGLLVPNYFDPFLLSIIHAFHFWLGGIFTYLYTRQMGLSRPPALVSSICFMLGGFLLGHAGHRNVIQTTIWLPLVLYFLDKAFLQRRAYWAVLAGFFLSISFLAGHANFFYFILLFLALYFLFRLYLGLRSKSWRNMAWDTFYFLVLGSFCLGISAIELWPLLSTSSSTYHGTLPFEWKADYYFPPFNLIHFLISGYTQWTATDIGEQYGYIGILPLLFALWGIFQAKEPKFKFLGLIALFAFIASLGQITPLYKLLYNILPGLKQFRVPARFNALIIFPLTILAGLGFQRLLEKIGREPMKEILNPIKILLSLVLGAGITILFIMIWLHQEPKGSFLGPWSHLKRDFYWFLFIWGASYLIVFRWHQVRSVKGFPISIILLISMDLLLLGRIDGNYSPNNPAGTSAQTKQIIEVLEKDTNPIRINNFKESVPLLYHLRDGVSVYDVGNLLGYVGMVVPTKYLEILFLTEKNPKLLDLLNVKYYIGTKPKVNNGLELLRIGGRYDNKELDFKGPTKISRLSLITTLSHSPSIPQGTIVAQVKLIEEDGAVQIIPIRAGIETAEWAIDRPGLYCAHGKAQISESWKIPGEGYEGHFYFFESPLSHPLEVSKIMLQYSTDQGELLIKKMGINGQDIESLLKERFQLIGPNIYKNNSSLPRVFMVAKAKAFDQKQELMEQLEQLDPQKTILLSQLPPGYHEPVDPSFSDQEATIILYSPNRIAVATQAREAKFLVLSDTYNPYWKATIDQKPAPILEIDSGLRGLYVPKGDHRIEFFFHFSPFYYGLPITCISLLLFFILSLGVIKGSYRKMKGNQSHDIKG